MQQLNEKGLPTIIWMLDLELCKPAGGGTRGTAEVVDDGLETRLGHGYESSSTSGGCDGM